MVTPSSASHPPSDRPLLTRLQGPIRLYRVRRRPPDRAHVRGSRRASRAALVLVDHSRRRSQARYPNGRPNDNARSRERTMPPQLGTCACHPSDRSRARDNAEPLRPSQTPGSVGHWPSGIRLDSHRDSRYVLIHAVASAYANVGQCEPPWSSITLLARVPHPQRAQVPRGCTGAEP
jgi:hypothetical protein